MSVPVPVPVPVSVSVPVSVPVSVSVPAVPLPLPAAVASEDACSVGVTVYGACVRVCAPMHCPVSLSGDPRTILLGWSWPLDLTFWTCAGALGVDMNAVSTLRMWCRDTALAERLSLLVLLIPRHS